MPIAFSHSPGCMFLTDRTCDEMQVLANSNTYPETKVVCIDEEEQVFSMISLVNWNKLTDLEQFVIDDPGNRGVGKLIQPTDLHCAALSISQSAKSVAIVTGFPCMPGNEPPIENDGISGAVAIAKAVQALGKPVTFIVDRRDVNIFRQIVSHCVQTGILKHEVSVTALGDSTKSILFDDLTEQARFSHLIGIERPGRTSTGIYSTMGKVDISHLCDPIDELFIEGKFCFQFFCSFIDEFKVHLRAKTKFTELY